MREAAFVKKNKERWTAFEKALTTTQPTNPDKLADLFIQITDDLAYARTFYNESNTAGYLNNLAGRVHQAIYRNKRESKSRILAFWKTELPLVCYQARRELLLSLVVFMLALLIGIFSTAYDDTFPRLILGDSYVNMTLENIENGSPMAVYESHNQTDMFFIITINNIWVSFRAFAWGAIASIGTLYVLFYNGIMIGAFQWFFYTQGVFLSSFLTIWIHGTLEISAIVLAGGAGICMGNSFLFPATYSRYDSFLQGAKRGLKICVGLVPIFIVAGFLESFVTRYAGDNTLPNAVKVLIISLSAAFIVGYFVVYPHRLARK